MPDTAVPARNTYLGTRARPLPRTNPVRTGHTGIRDRGDRALLAPHVPTEYLVSVNARPVSEGNTAVGERGPGGAPGHPRAPAGRYPVARSRR